MKQLKILYSNNTNQLFVHSLKKIAPFLKDLSKQNIIIVPDKLSLATEQEIFEVLGIDVYYNLSVMGISKFASNIINENNLDMIQCTSLQAKLLTLKAIQNVCKNFKCFSQNYTLGFVDEIYAKIEQIKSSNANIADLVDEKASIGTKLKFDDIKLIYNEYEKLRAGKIDSGALLDVFNKTCFQSESLKDTNVFFVGFDSLTKQGLQVLTNVAKNANYTQISITYARGQDNTRIFDQTFFDSVINVCKNEQIDCKADWCDLPFENENKNKILYNLFSRKQKFDKENDFYQIVKTNSFLEEIEICVKQIVYLLKTTNVKFNDIAVCCDKSYFGILRSELGKVGVSVFSDEQTSLCDLEPIKYLLNILEFIESKNNKLLFEILTNDFCGLEKESAEQYLTYLRAYNSSKIIKEKKIDDIASVSDYVEDLLQTKFLAKDKIENYIENIKNIIKKYEIIEKINKKCEFFEEKQEILLNKTFLQVEKKLSDCMEILIQTLAGTEMNFDEFFELLKKVLSENSISSVPTCVNQIFVGDVKSFYFNKKYLFVLGMNEGLMPSVLSDTGLISDKEIISESIIAKLEPTTKIINKRNRFKLFENILSATKKCFMFYHTFGADNKNSQANEFISEFEFLFNNQVVSSQALKSFGGSINNLCFNMIDVYNANKFLAGDLNLKTYTLVKSALSSNGKLFSLCENVVTDQVKIGKLFFRDNKTSISVIEKYSACPKSAYLANALKLQPIKNEKVEANIVGSFLHEIGEKFVRFNMSKLGKMQKDEIYHSVQSILKTCLDGEEYYALKLPNNSFLLNLLKAEAERFCNFLNDEQVVSDFKPIYVEKRFGVNNDFKPIELLVGEKKYTISGIVDRIDECEQSFRIIDYKTGNTTNAGGAESLYYGTKIQLFVYAFGMKQNLNKKFFGAFYLPIKNGFTKPGQEQYVLSGFFENDTSLAIKCDKNLLSNGKSNLIGASFLKVKDDGELNLKKKVNILTNDELTAYLDYSLELVKVAIADIESGYIDCSPIKDKCNYCEFNTICRFAFDEKVQRNEKFDISSVAIKNLIKGDQNGKN